MAMSDRVCFVSDMLWPEVAVVPMELLVGVPAVLAVAREGSATRAAAVLATTTATVLRRIDGAEEALGVRLFERLPTGLVATGALAVVLPWAEQCVAAVEGMQRDVTGLDLLPSGVVRVAVPPALGALLVPRLGALREAWPRVVVELVASNAVADLGRQEADLAVRPLRPTEGDLVTKRVGDYRTVVACVPELVGRGLAEVPWVGWEGTLAHIPEARWLAAAVPQAHVVLRASDMTTLLAAAQAGLGAVVVAEPLAAQIPGLVEMPGTEGMGLPTGALWLVAHRALRDVPRVAIVWRWLEGCFDAMEGARLG
jgi:DNA-binding transcriptional LysR family regulator